MESVTVKDVLGDKQLPQKIHVITKGTPVKEVLETFYRHNILSAPVVDFELKCEGLVDVLDVLAFMVQVAHEPVQSRVSPISTNLNNDDLEMLFQRSEKFNTTNVTSKVNLSTRNPFLPCTLGAPLVDVLRNFAQGVHRVPVVEADNPNSIVALLSQSDANRFLAADPEKFLGKERAQSSIEALGLVCGGDKLITVTSNTKAIDAFFTMYSNGLSAIAVVNEQGAYQGSLSATDLKLITDYRFQSLLMPVIEFLEHVRQGRAHPSSDYRASWCIPSTPLQTVLKRLAEEHLHRLYVVEPVSMKPVGVVSLTDIARVVVKGH